MAKSKKPGALFVVLALVAGTWWWFVGHESGRVAVEHGLCGSNGPSVKTASSDPSGVQPAILTAANELVSAKTGEERLAALAGLRAALASGLTNEVSAAIRRFLDSKLDAATGLGFKIGQGGFLMHAPTLRTWLLDYLAQIDPAAAAEYAKVILNSSDSSDEWAVALRSLAVGDNSAEARDLLETKMSELLQNQAWQQNPSTGYLEAFDTAVYLGGADLLPPLANLVQGQDNQAVAYAAFLALDRMVINDPVDSLTALAEDPGLLQGRESTRADYFARADVQDAQQRQILENYLLNPQLSPAELEQFAGIFPNANYMISANLLTANPTPDHAALAARDQASLQVVGEWLADPRFANLRPQLQLMQPRLQQFVQQEQAAGPGR